MARKANPNDMVSHASSQPKIELDDKSDQYTTEGLALSGSKDLAIDKDQQPQGGGAPATTLPGPPLKEPMFPSDVTTPKIRDGVGASLLMRSARQLARIDPPLARRLARLAQQLGPKAEDITTATLELSGDDDSVDDGQEKGHGQLQFFGTDPAKASQVDLGATSPKASRRAELPQRGRDRSEVANEWQRGLEKLAEKVKSRNPNLAKKILRVIKSLHVELDNIEHEEHENRQMVFRDPKASRKAEGSPTVQDSEQEASGAQGTGGFAGEKAPLKDMTQPGDVQTPKLKEASKTPSIWKALKQVIRTASRTGGDWNGGQYGVEAQDYGATVEIEGQAQDREGTPLSAGIVSMTVVHDSPQGRFATVEIRDAVIANRVTEVTLRPSDVKRFASDWIREVSGVARDLLKV